MLSHTLPQRSLIFAHRRLTAVKSQCRRFKCFTSTTRAHSTQNKYIRTRTLTSVSHPPQSVYIGQPASWTHPHLVKSDELTPMVPFDEYERRRQALMDSLPPNSCVILPSHAPVFMSADIPYPFRQNCDFVYFCGFEEPDAVCIIRTQGNALSNTDGEEIKMALIVKPKDAHQEKWHGTRTGVDFAKAHFGASDAFQTRDLQFALEQYTKDAQAVYYDANTPVHAGFHRTIVDHLITKKMSYKPLQLHVQKLRLLKSDNEANIMRKCASISSKAFIQTIKATKPGVSEHELDAVMDFECRRMGCKRLAYPPVVAGGNRANTLHYVNNNAIVEDGDLVLIDAGGELYNYAADITRTYPANGKFSPPQKLVYEAVLRTLESLTTLCRPSQRLSLMGLHEQSRRFLFDELVTLGCITGEQTQSNLQKLNRWYPHNIGHHVGMDTHDVSLVSNSEPLTKGMVITLEPGLYFPNDDLDVPVELRGIGVRIEDNILLTDDGCEVLTGSCPKRVADIEALMQ